MISSSEDIRNSIQGRRDKIIKLLDEIIKLQTGQEVNSSKMSCSKNEELCRQSLEKLYGKPFPSVRPDWLVNPKTGKNLELDCYNEELGIALNYYGEQHYRFPNRYHNTLEEYQRQIARDEFRMKMCEIAGIYYIVVPYDIPRDRIEEFIKWPTY